MTATVWSASLSLSTARALRSEKRRDMEKAPPNKSTTSKISTIARRRDLRGWADDVLGSISDSCCTSCVIFLSHYLCGLLCIAAGIRTPAAMHHAEHHGYKEQRGHGGKYQSTNHGASQGRVLLAALTQSERHRHHADDHRHCRHDHRAHTRVSRVEGRL